MFLNWINCVVSCQIASDENVKNLSSFCRIFPKTSQPAHEHVLNAFYQVVAHGRLLGHMKSGFSRLKLLTVKKVCVALNTNK